MTHVHGLKSQKIVYHLKQRKAICPNVPHLKFLSPKGKQFYLSLPFILPPFNPVTLTSGLFLEHAKLIFILRPSLYSNIFFPKNSTMTTLFKTVTLMHCQSLFLFPTTLLFIMHIVYYLSLLEDKLYGGINIVSDEV